MSALLFLSLALGQNRSSVHICWINEVLLGKYAGSFSGAVFRDVRKSDVKKEHVPYSYNALTLLFRPHYPFFWHS